MRPEYDFRGARRGVYLKHYYRWLKRLEAFVAMAERRIIVVVTRQYSSEDSLRFKATFEDLGVALSAQGSTVEEAYRNAKVLALQTMALQLEVEPLATDVFDTIVFVKVLPAPEPAKECEADGAYSP